MSVSWVLHERTNGSYVGSRISFCELREDLTATLDDNILQGRLFDRWVDNQVVWVRRYHVGKGGDEEKGTL